MARDVKRFLQWAVIAVVTVSVFGALSWYSVVDVGDHLGEKQAFSVALPCGHVVTRACTESAEGVVTGRDTFSDDAGTDYYVFVRSSPTSGVKSDRFTVDEGVYNSVEVGAPIHLVRFRGQVVRLSGAGVAFRNVDHAWYPMGGAFVGSVLLALVASGLAGLASPSEPSPAEHDPIAGAQAEVAPDSGVLAMAQKLLSWLAFAAWLGVGVIVVGGAVSLWGPGHEHLWFVYVGGGAGVIAVLVNLLVGPVACVLNYRRRRHPIVTGTGLDDGPVDYRSRLGIHRA